MNISIQTNMSLLQQLDNEAAKLVSPVVAYMVIIMVSGIAGNSLVCYVHGTRMKKSTANSFVLWLGLTDLLTCVVGLPMEIYDLLRHYTMDNPDICKVMRFTVYLSTMTSVVTLVFIAVDRYWKICRPLKMTPVRRCRVVVAVSVIVGLIFSWPSLVLFGRKRISTPYPGIYGVDCSMDDSMMGTMIPKLYLSILIFAFFVGAVILTVLYTLIGWHVYKRSRLVIGENVQTTMLRGNSKFRCNITKKVQSPRIGSERHPSRSTQCDSRYKLGRTAVIFFTITVFFIATYLPSLALMITRTVHKTFTVSLSNSEYVFYSFGLRTYFINNAINPVIYGVFNGIFRKECVKLWQSCKSVLCTCKIRNTKLEANHRKSNSDCATDGSLTSK